MTQGIGGANPHIHRHTSHCPLLCCAALRCAALRCAALCPTAQVQERGGVVESFESVCGGLPAPECADNPLGYKFSWNPRGVLTATQNPAKYLRNGKVIEVSATDLLRAARPFDLNPAFNLEVLPNRDSLSYAADYGLQSAHTLFRGTLRYHGFSSIVDRLRAVGLLSADRWIDLKQHHNWVRGMSMDWFGELSIDLCMCMWCVVWCSLGCSVQCWTAPPLVRWSRRCVRN
jgi:hypothetical protein